MTLADGGMDTQVIRNRYAIFKEHYGSLLKLSKMFPFRTSI